MKSNTFERYIKKIIIIEIYAGIALSVIPFVGLMRLFIEVSREIPIHAVHRIQSLDEIGSMPNDRIDLFQAALLLSKEIDPTVDIQDTLDRLDSLAHRAMQRVRWQFTIEKKLQALAHFLFNDRGFSPTNFEEGGIDNFLVDRLFDTKRGDCLTLSLLYHGLAKRLGIPIQIVVAHERYHVFICCNDHNQPLYIETTANGGFIRDVTGFCQNELLGPYEILNNRQAIAVIITEIANQYHHTQQEKMAIQTYYRALTYYPEYVVTLTYLGILHPDPDRSIEYTRKATQLNPHFALAFYHYGLALQNDKQYEPAIEAYREAIRLDPNQYQALNNLGTCLESLGNNEEARHCYLDAIDLDPHFALPYYNLALLYSKNEEYFNAAPYFQQSIDRGYKSPEIYQMLAGCLLYIGNKEESMKITKEGLELYPGHTVLQWLLDEITKDIKATQ